MADEQRSREEKGTPDRQGQDQHSKAGKGGQRPDDDKNRGTGSERERGSSPGDAS